MRTTLKRVLPKSWIIAVRTWRRPDPPPLRVMAFRCALASRLARMLEQDAALLRDSRNPSHVALDEAQGRTFSERGSRSPDNGHRSGRESMSRLSAFLDDVVSSWRRDGYRASFKLVRTRVYERTDTLLYELRTTGKAPELPADWQVTVVCSADDTAGVDLLCRTGGESEVRQFRRNAVAYVLSIGSEPVARAWYYPNNALVRRLGPNAAYFGSMFVLPEWRGLGIQGLLNAYMASFLPMGTRILMEILASNVASQKGVVKGNAVYIGRLDMIVFLGRIIRAHVEAPSERTP
jgi:GNAT superfamily N-acetyltransferase